MEYWISLFIDDELNLDEKIGFVEKIHGDIAFKDESLALLHQEKQLRAEVVDQPPEFKLTFGEVSASEQKPLQRGLLQHFGFIFRPWGILATALVVLALVVFADLDRQPLTTITRNRFLIYEPGTAQVEISGTFTSWERIPMRRVGSSGYWEASLNLPAGEHRYFYVLDGRQQVADPTVQTREKDDFGGENSVLFVEGSI